MCRSWSTHLLIVLGCVLVNAGCVQTPSGKSVQDLRPIKADTATAKKQDLSASDIVLAQANVQEREKRLIADIALLEKMREPGNPQAMHATRKLALLYEANGNFDRAEDEYKRLVQQNPKDADALAKLGDLFSRRGQWDAAEKWYRDALFVSPTHTSARANLGFTLAQKGNYDESLRELSQVVSPAEAYCEIAFVLKLKGKGQDALHAYEQALRLDPTMERARLEMLRIQQARHQETPTPPAHLVGRPATVQLIDAPAPVVNGMEQVLRQRPTLPPINYDAVPAQK